MKIALFTDTYPPEVNGVATSCKSLRDILVKNGEEVLVVTTNPTSNKLTFEDNVVRIPGIELKKLYGYRLAGYNHKAMKIVRQFEPDIIHVQTDVGIGFFAKYVAHQLKCPTIYTYHTMLEDYTYYVTKGVFDRAGKAFIREFSRSMIEGYNGFITPSNKTKDYIRRIGIDTYANVIPTGVDFSKFNRENLDENIIKDLKKKFGLSEKTFVLLSLGRIAKEKSIDFSLTCYAKFLKDNPKIDSKMVIVGKGPAEDALKELAKELGIEKSVIFAGPCDPSEVQYYYTLGDAFVSASLTETQGLTYMEAMASHLYVLARYDHNLIDVVQEGTTGFFFENEEEFSDKLFKAYQLWKAKDDKMLVEALKSIGHYSIETFYKRIKEAYMHVIKQCW